MSKCVFFFQTQKLFLLVSLLLFLLSNGVNFSLRCNPQQHKFGISMGVFLEQPEEEVFQTNHHQL